MKLKNILRMLPGSRSCEKNSFSGCFLLLNFHSYFFTPSMSMELIRDTFMPLNLKQETRDMTEELRYFLSTDCFYEP